MNVVGRGIPVSTGRAAGQLHVDIDDALDAIDAGDPVVVALDRPAPADVPAMIRAAAVITVCSDPNGHAAVVTRDAGVPAVVGVNAMTIVRGGVDIDGQYVPIGATLTVDGTTGEVGLQ